MSRHAETREKTPCRRVVRFSGRLPETQALLELSNIQLAGRAQGKALNLDKSRRHHERRQALPAIFGQHPGLDPRRLEVHQQQLRFGSLVIQQHHTIEHSRVTLEGGGDLGQRQALATQLDLVIAAAMEVIEPLAIPGNQVATAVATQRPALPWQVDEALPGQPGIPQIPRGQAAPGDQQLAGFIHLARLPVRAQQQQGGIVHGLADGNVPGAVEAAGNGIDTGTHGVFRGAITVVENQPIGGSIGLADMPCGQDLTADHQPLDAPQPAAVDIDEGVEQGRGQPQAVDPGLVDVTMQVFQGQGAGNMDMQFAAIEQRGPDLELRGVEGQVRGVQHAKARLQRKMSRPVAEPQHPAMGTGNDLRRAGGAAGKVHVHRLGAA